MRRRLVQVAFAALCLAVFAVPSSAQVFTGRIDVVAKDNTGAVLPGVAVEIAGVQAAKQVTDTRGEAHFLSLAPGRYTVTAKLSGFNDYSNNNVPVSAGSIVQLDITLSVGGVKQDVTVTAETPVIDAKKQVIATNVTLDELQNVPSSRDPWVVLQTVPGIIVDRVNVGGAESGQQSNYQAKGASGGDNTWNIDGIAITDMAALGSSPTYYDFDMFQEMQITTGGADPSNPTGGIQLNFVLKSGTNRWRASSRYYYANNDLQSDNLPSGLKGNLLSYNRFEYNKDYGVEGGGPVLKDRLWVWGSYGYSNPAMEIYSYRAAATPGTTKVPGLGCALPTSPVTLAPVSYNLTGRDCTELENFGGKVSGTINDQTRASFTYFRGDKIKIGRLPGSADLFPAPTTWHQTGPTSLYKGEVNYSPSSALFLTGRFAYTDGGFGFEPLGGRDVQPILTDTGVWDNTFAFYKTERPQQNAQLEGNYFRGQHEFKFGFGWRKSSVASQSGYPQQILSWHVGYPTIFAQFTRDWAQAANTVYYSAFVGDQISWGRMTLNLGVRWDRQTNSLEAATVPANPWTSLPVVLNTLPAPYTGRDLLPSLTADGRDNLVTYNTITPRIGLTYALTEDRRTILRTSYAMFASQLDSARGYTVSPIPGTPTGSGYVYWLAQDLNGNRVVEENELIPGGFIAAVGFDPDDPLGGNKNRIGDYKVPMTHEFVLGAEHEVMRNFGISTAYTWRRYNNFNWTPLAGVTSADYVQTGTYTGNVAPVGPFAVPFYAINPAAVPDDFGAIHEERKGYTQRYWGLEIAATKRMSNRWMMRLGWSTNDHREYFDGPDSLGDPTPGTTTPNVDGGEVIRVTGGSGKANIFMILPKYQWITTAAYQAKYGFTFGMNYVFRQGFSTPYFRSLTPGSADVLSPNGKTVLLVSDVGDYRLPSVHSFDGRVSWGRLFQDRYSVNLDLDIFNVFNNATILGRALDQRLTSFNQAREIMNPRIFRVGARIGF